MGLFALATSHVDRWFSRLAWVPLVLVSITVGHGQQPQAGQGEQIADYVVEIFEDSGGALWMGTMTKGAVRYDGNELTYLTTRDGLSGDTVVSFAEDADGHLWIGTQSGISRFDGDRIRRFGPAEGLRGNVGQVFVDRDGQLWVCMDHAVFRYDGTRFVEFKLPIEIDEIDSYAVLKGNASLDLQDRQGNLWFGTDGYGAIRYDGKSFQRFTKADGLCSNNVTRIREDANGNIWFACIQSFTPKETGDGGLCRFDGERFRSFPDVKGLHRNDIYTIFIDRNDTLWIGATGHGVYRYEKGLFTLIPETNRMDLTYGLGLQEALEDTHGNLWFGFSGGLFRLDGEAIINVTQAGPWGSKSTSHP